MLGGTRHVTVTPRSLSLPVTLFRDLSHMCRPLSTNHYNVGTSINTTKTARHGLVCLCFKPFWLSEVTRTLRRRHVLGRSSPPLLNTPSNEQLGQRATGNWKPFCTSTSGVFLAVLAHRPSLRDRRPRSPAAEQTSARGAQDGAARERASGRADGTFGACLNARAVNRGEDPGRRQDASSRPVWRGGTSGERGSRTSQRRFRTRRKRPACGGDGEGGRGRRGSRNAHAAFCARRRPRH